jgi:hypothetical protein
MEDKKMVGGETDKPVLSIKMCTMKDDSLSLNRIARNP